MTVRELIDKLQQVKDKHKTVVQMEQESRGALEPWQITEVIEYKGYVVLSWSELDFPREDTDKIIKRY